MTLRCQPRTVTVPLTERFHQTAQQFYHHHNDAQKAKHVYLNILCVQTMDFYLACLGIETDLEKSESWNPILQVLSNGADLWVNNWGRLECCPVLPEQTTWTIPAEAWDDRVGYVFIRLDESLTEATLLGFLPQAMATVTAAQLQPIDDFPDYMHQATQTVAAPIQPVATTLQRWLTQLADESWISLEQIFADWQTQMPAYSFRNSLAQQELIETPTVGIKQGKFLTLSQATQVLFIVGIVPALERATFDITVELYPAGQQTHLPTALQLIVLDEAQVPVLQAEGRQSEGLEFQFSAEAGENFAVQISLDQSILTELFAI